MKNMPISTFKARALQVIGDVERTRESLVITKRGRPVAQVSPYRGIDAEPVPGKLSHTLVFEGDIVSPLGPESWEASE